jgi:uncharacterized protein (TIGR02145 family)
MTDQEGNEYKTILIGTQEWMAENLNTSIYRNGDAIATNLDNATWSATTSGAWAYFENEESYACPYGKLYNWYTCMDGRGLCPVGWHVPSHSEWNILRSYLDPLFDPSVIGSYSMTAGGKMKTVGTIELGTGLWYEPNTGATNISGFSGAPGGFRYFLGVYNIIGETGAWWSSTENGLNYAWGCILSEDRAEAGPLSCFTQDGLSVRCLRD